MRSIFWPNDSVEPYCLLKKTFDDRIRWIRGVFMDAFGASLGAAWGVSGTWDGVILRVTTNRWKDR